MIVIQQRTKVDFAHQMKALVEECPEAKKIRVVLANLNTHTTVALYQAFPLEQARTIASKLEFYYTPKHGSWLNQVKLNYQSCHNNALTEGLEIYKPYNRIFLLGNGIETEA